MHFKTTTANHAFFSGLYKTSMQKDIFAHFALQNIEICTLNTFQQVRTKSKTKKFCFTGTKTKKKCFKKHYFIV